jgi:hypothetical protein
LHFAAHVPGGTTCATNDRTGWPSGRTIKQNPA